MTMLGWFHLLRIRISDSMVFPFRFCRRSRRHVCSIRIRISTVVVDVATFVATIGCVRVLICISTVAVSWPLVRMLD